MGFPDKINKKLFSILNVFCEFPDNVPVDIQHHRKPTNSKKSRFRDAKGYEIILLKVTLKIKPKYNLDNIKEAPTINLTEQGHLVQIKGMSHASLDLQKAEVAERQAKSAKLLLTHLKVVLV